MQGNGRLVSSAVLFPLRCNSCMLLLASLNLFHLVSCTNWLSTWGSFVPAVLPQRPLSSRGNWRLGFKIMYFSQRKTVAYCHAWVFIPYLLWFQVEWFMCKPEHAGVNHCTGTVSLELLLGVSSGCSVWTFSLLGERETWCGSLYQRPFSLCRKQCRWYGQNHDSGPQEPYVALLWAGL